MYLIRLHKFVKKDKKLLLEWQTFQQDHVDTKKRIDYLFNLMVNVSNTFMRDSECKTYLYFVDDPDVKVSHGTLKRVFYQALHFLRRHPEFPHVSLYDLNLIHMGNNQDCKMSDYIVIKANSTKEGVEWLKNYYS